MSSWWFPFGVHARECDPRSEVCVARTDTSWKLPHFFPFEILSKTPFRQKSRKGGKEPDGRERDFSVPEILGLKSFLGRPFEW